MIDRLNQPKFPRAKKIMPFVCDAAAKKRCVKVRPGRILSSPYYIARQKTIHPCHQPYAPNPVMILPLSRGSDGAPRTLGHTSLETVLELPGNLAEVSHAAGTGDLSPLSLLGPVVCNHSRPCQQIRPRLLLSSSCWLKRTLAGLSSGVAAGSAGLLLVVQGTATVEW